MKILLPLVSLLALAVGRKLLCADLKLPICRPNGANPYPAVYRPVWRNFGQGASENIDAGHGCYPGDGPPECEDGSTAQFVFNVCKNDQKQCPHGYGQNGGSKPFDACPNGKQPLCPSGQTYTCAFRHKRCPGYGHTVLPRKQCKKGRPHCPWFTRNRNNEWDILNKKYNQGPNRPQNKVNGNGIHQPEYERPCAGACPCDNVHLFNATTVRWILLGTEDSGVTVTSWQTCGTVCQISHALFNDCEFWEWHKKGPHKDYCKLVSNYRKGVKQTNNDYKVVSGSRQCSCPLPGGTPPNCSP